MNKTVKVISTILMVILLVSMFSSVVMASNPAEQVKNFTSSNSTPGQSEIQGLAGNVISILTTVGIAVAIIILLILGIKYMMGSASEKAEYKKTMIPYLVGAVLIFGASGIAKLVISMTTYSAK